MVCSFGYNSLKYCVTIVAMPLFFGSEYSGKGNVWKDASTVNMYDNVKEWLYVISAYSRAFL